MKTKKTYSLADAAKSARRMATQAGSPLFDAAIGQLAYKYMAYVNSNNLENTEAVYLGHYIATLQEELPQLVIVPVAPPEVNRKPLDVEYVDSAEQLR